MQTEKKNEEKTAKISIQLLGTSSGIPTEHRGVSCTALSVNKNILLFDCGKSLKSKATLHSQHLLNCKFIEGDGSQVKKNY